ncbi:MAG TPA: aldose 1-epimerase [Acetobacteraceae bacterium]
MLTLRAGDATVELAPETGGSIARFHWRDRPVMRDPWPEAPPGPRGLACYPMVPFSNRIARRRFTWGGVTHRLPALLAGHAIHGAGWQQAWEARRIGESEAELSLSHQPGPLWPFAFHATQHFSLDPDGLSVEFAIRNEHEAPAPAGFGLHPFFPREPGMTLTFAAPHVWLNEEPEKVPLFRIATPPEWDHSRGLPVGQVLNECFAGWEGQARLQYPTHAVTIEADPLFRHLVVFVPEGQHFLAVEPVTNMNDGLNRMGGGVEHNVFVLAPGATRRGRVRFGVEMTA